MYKKLLKLSIASGFLLATPWAHAQVAPDPVQYVITPDVPGPNQQVTIEAQGLGTFLGNATIIWKKDGQVVQSGAGLRTYSFITGAVGSITKVRVDIQSPTEGTYGKDFVFRPSLVNLVWEADTWAPPLYRGKPLYSAGSPLKVAAFPMVIINNAQVAASSLSYQWTRNDEPLPAQSGLGRNTLSFDGDQLQAQETIAVDVYFGTSLVGRGGVVIPVSQPQVVLYERDSLRGVLYDLALPSSLSLSTKEITIAAQPYNFSRVSVIGGAVQYEWTLSGEGIAGPDSSHGILTLRQTGTGTGSAALEVSLQNNNQNQLVQAAQTVLGILFGQPGSATASFFGI
ncbi:MAG: hypothetical protein JWL87_600 [Candidatus Adlerbacteria bacterium]|nr:hypothetical protein [Candidatus Adlerbacteria bacterium]